MLDFSLSHEILVQRFNVVFYWGMFLVMLFTCVYVIAPADELSDTKQHYHYRSVGLSLGVIVLLCFLMALYPIQWGTFGDREGYLYMFNNVAQTSFSDPFWRFLNVAIRNFTVNQVYFFLIMALLYVGLRYWACYNFNKNYSFLLFAMLISSFQFLSYGVNTIRSGVASSFLLLAFSVYSKEKTKEVLTFLLVLASVGIHKSMALPAFMFLLSVVFPRPKFYLLVWLSSFVFSAILGGFFESNLGNLIEQNVGSQAGEYILNESTSGYKRGFRLDFILYSLAPILLGAYYIVKKSFQDKLYISLYCTYILTNAVFVLVIRANFVDRFGYLSWLMIPFILLYPLLKVRLFEKQNNKIALILFLNTVFTMLMYIRG